MGLLNLCDNILKVQQQNEATRPWILAPVLKFFMVWKSTFQRKKWLHQIILGEVQLFTTCLYPHFFMTILRRGSNNNPLRKCRINFTMFENSTKMSPFDVTRENSKLPNLSQLSSETKEVNVARFARNFVKWDIFVDF